MTLTTKEVIINVTTFSDSRRSSSSNSSSSSSSSIQPIEYHTPKILQICNYSEIVHFPIKSESTENLNALIFRTGNNDNDHFILGI